MTAFCAILHKFQVKCRVISPRGVIVPHRNRTRVWGGSPYGGRAGARPSQCAAKMAAFPVNAAFQTVQERFPSQEVIQKAGENIISRQKRC